MKPSALNLCFCFESRLVSSLFLILGWGYQPGRVQGGIYLLFYTLLASLPLLVGILFVYISLGSLCLFLFCGDNSLVGGLFYVCMIFAFLVKVPIIIVRFTTPFCVYMLCSLGRTQKVSTDFTASKFRKCSLMIEVICSSPNIGTHLPDNVARQTEGNSTKSP